MRIIAAFIFLCSLVGLFAPFVPLADLFNHFRIQAVAGLFFCFLCFCALRDKRGAVLCFLALALNLGLVGEKLYKTSGIPSLGSNLKPSISILSTNVLTSNTRYDDVLALIEKENPDFIVFTEVNNEWIKRLQSLEVRYKYSYKLPSEDNFGIAGYSTLPFEGSVKYSGGAALPILVANLKDGLTVIAIHPLPPSSEWNLSENRIYLSDVAQMVSKKDGPVVVTGDFNSTLWSTTLVPLIEGGLKRINPLGIAYTWPVSDILFAVQIDHFFGKGIKAADFEVLPSVGSDHYPIRADLAY